MSALFAAALLNTARRGFSSNTVHRCLSGAAGPAQSAVWKEFVKKHPLPAVLNYGGVAKYYGWGVNALPFYQDKGLTAKDFEKDVQGGIYSPKGSITAEVLCNLAMQGFLGKEVPGLNVRKPVVSGGGYVPSGSGPAP